MLDLETWHPADFNLLSERENKPPLGEYPLTVENYLSKRKVVSDFLGSDQYLWCFYRAPQASQITIGAHWRWMSIAFVPTHSKPKRWLLRIAPVRVFGYVRNDIWENIVHDRCKPAPVQEYVFSSQPDASIPCTTLARFPLLPGEIIGHELYVPENGRWVRRE